MLFFFEKKSDGSDRCQSIVGINFNNDDIVENISLNSPVKIGSFFSTLAKLSEVIRKTNYSSIFNLAINIHKFFQRPERIINDNSVWVI